MQKEIDDAQKKQQNRVKMYLKRDDDYSLSLVLPRLSEYMSDTGQDLQFLSQFFSSNCNILISLYNQWSLLPL